jgi:hypothetical protein
LINKNGPMIRNRIVIGRTSVIIVPERRHPPVHSPEGMQ